MAYNPPTPAQPSTVDTNDNCMCSMSISPRNPLRNAWMFPSRLLIALLRRQKGCVSLLVFPRKNNKEKIKRISAFCHANDCRDAAGAREKMKRNRFRFLIGARSTEREHTRECGNCSAERLHTRTPESPGRGAPFAPFSSNRT